VETQVSLKIIWALLLNLWKAFCKLNFKFSCIWNKKSCTKNPPKLPRVFLGVKQIGAQKQRRWLEEMAEVKSQSLKVF